MGIDVYLSWVGLDDEDQAAQVTGFSTRAGEKGYLREAYHGGPYATHVMFPECWGDDPYAPERMTHFMAEMFSEMSNVTDTEFGPESIGPPETEMMDELKQRVQEILDSDEDVAKTIDDAILSAPPGDEAGAYRGVAVPYLLMELRMPSVIAAAWTRAKQVYQEDDSDAWLSCQAFIDFAELARKKEIETGFPCRVYVSY